MTLQQNILLYSLLSQYNIELVRYYAGVTHNDNGVQQAVLLEIKRQIHEIAHEHKIPRQP